MENRKVHTCDFYRTDPDLPRRFNDPDCFHGYGGKQTHPLYRTSNQTYGSEKPTVHEMPMQYRGKCCQFSEALLQHGMYRDNTFNTNITRSRVTVTTETQHRRAAIHHLYHAGNQSGHEGSSN
ncbi:UPF0691 protein C9orf116-like [Oryzias melastigma]|uniref:UPF0691 protein C9orf116-like n=1 Tax=Oryzias melastigma TaxID=30732 RepID=A0A834BQX4_ORYME|nr:UPF0691 protein C9orf116 homolog [Oryzias melastigma]KAF6715639.1 UPF0691 protein C9orf116-like [Oryzias melastigma]